MNKSFLQWLQEAPTRARKSNSQHLNRHTQIQDLPEIIVTDPDSLYLSRCRSLWQPTDLCVDVIKSITDYNAERLDQVLRSIVCNPIQRMRVCNNVHERTLTNEETWTQFCNLFDNNINSWRYFQNSISFPVPNDPGFGNYSNLWEGANLTYRTDLVIYLLTKLENKQ